MSIVLFDNDERDKLYPLNTACATADLRVGIFTFRERWQHISGEAVYVQTAEHLSVLYEPIPGNADTWIEANLIPDEQMLQQILNLKEDEALASGEILLAGKKKFSGEKFSPSKILSSFKTIQQVKYFKRLEYPWRIFQWNNEMLRRDFARITAGRASQPIRDGNRCTDAGNIFVEDGGSINYSIINAATGPVYIGKNCEVMEGSMIRGPVALCEGAALKMGARVYGATTLGPYCVGGGEIKNVVMQGYSNKSHDGYVGDSVIGRWCNLGAGTSNSNIKNTAGVVKMWSAVPQDYLPVDVKCGMIMGDYSRTAINTSVNTGTVIGICSNVFGDGLLPKYIRDFQWGVNGEIKYHFDKALHDIASWKKLKGAVLKDSETKVLTHIFAQISA